MRTYPVSCNLDCGAGCPLSAEVSDGKLIAVRDSAAAGPDMRGCVKGFRVPELLYSPERLKQPLLRRGARGSDDFVTISWQEAYERIAVQMKRSLELSGGYDILRIGGSGSCRGAVHNTSSLAKRFLSCCGNYTDTAGNYSSEAVDFINPHIFGTILVGQDIHHVLDSSCIILWGFNPFVTRFGCETEQVLLQAVRKGIPCIVIDPRKTRSVDVLGAQWMNILPGTDGYLAAALAYILLEKRPEMRQEIREYAEGTDAFCDYVEGKVDGIPKDPALAARVCGLPAAEIEQLASYLLQDAPAAILPGLSVQRVLGAENTQRLMIFCQLLAGNIGIPGGSVGGGQWNMVPHFYCPSIPNGGRSDRRVPVYRWADAVIEGTGGGYPSDIRFLYNCGGNYLTQSSDTQKVIKACESVDFIVTHDMFMTPTCRYSDIILPVAMFPEREDICFTNNGLLLYSAKAVEPVEGLPTDYEIFSELSSLLGCQEDFTEGRSASDWVDELLKESDVEDIAAFKQHGIAYSEERPYLGLAEFMKDPAAHPLDTPSGRIELVSEHYEAAGGDTYPLLNESVCTESYPLHMITPHPRYRIHSQHHMSESLRRRMDDRIYMNPVDARRRGLSEGRQVMIRNPIGWTSGTLHLSEAVSPGVVSKDQGVWYNASEEIGDCNRLSSDSPTLPSEGSRTHTIAVEVFPL